MNIRMRRSKGFTIIEMLVVLGIIALILSMVGPRMVKLMSRGSETSAKSTLSTLKNAVLEYQLEIGSQPKTLEHLIRNVDNNPKWKGPYIEGITEIPADPWGSSFIYNKPPKVFTKEYKYFEILSPGEKGEAEEPEDYIHVGS